MKRPRVVPRQDIFIYIALLTLTSLLYCRVVGFDFISMDDYIYVAENPYVRSGITLQNIRWAFTTTHASNWHPFTWLSLMLDTNISYGVSSLLEESDETPIAGFYHLTNILLHTLNVVLIYVLFSKITRAKWPTAFAAAAFAVHPLHVESVAWISERKDVLSTAFWLLTMLAYIRYVNLDGNRRLKAYILMIALFSLGLAAKPMLVTLPFVLILLDYWPLGRISSQRPIISQESSAFGLRARVAALRLPIVRDKIPLFLLSAASCIVTYWAQAAGGAVQTFTFRPIGVRIANALISYIAYLLKAFYPARLAAYYPHPGTSIPPWQVVASALALISVPLFAFRLRKTHPWLIIGWLWYIVTLIPVIGLVQVGDQAMADRYTYVPLIGIFLSIAFCASELFKGPRESKMISSIAIIAIMILAACSYVQLGYWRNGITLFEHTIAVTSPQNVVALFNLGVAYQKQQFDDAKAAEIYKKAVSIEPRFLEAHFNLGNALTNLERFDEAWCEYQAALRLNPCNSSVYAAMGYLLAKNGRIDEACCLLKKALIINPNNVDAIYNLEVLEDIKKRGEPWIGSSSNSKIAN